MHRKWQEIFKKPNHYFGVIAGPCSIETKDQFLSTCEEVYRQGASFLRGGIYKLRTSPESFQGLGSDAFPLVEEAKKTTNMPFIAEITDPRQINRFLDFVDIIQVGSRNMYNYALLKELSQVGKPVLLKRGFSATIDEWVKAADYLKSDDQQEVILCERGIRSFDNKTRNVFDLGAITYLKTYTEHTVYADPSHASGDCRLIPALSKAALMAGADGLMLEVHPNPEKALSDGPQALDFASFQKLMTEIKALLPNVDKELFSHELQ